MSDWNAYWEAHRLVCYALKDDISALEAVSEIDKYIDSLEKKLEKLNKHLEEKDKRLLAERDNLLWHNTCGPPLCLVETQIKNNAKIREIIDG